MFFPPLSDKIFLGQWRLPSVMDTCRWCCSDSTWQHILHQSSCLNSFTSSYLLLHFFWLPYPFLYIWMLTSSGLLSFYCALFNSNFNFLLSGTPRCFTYPFFNSSPNYAAAMLLNMPFYANIDPYIFDQILIISACVMVHNTACCRHHFQSNCQIKLTKLGQQF